MRRRALLPLGLLAVLIVTRVAAFAYADERVYRLGFLSPSAGSFEVDVSLKRVRGPVTLRVTATDLDGASTVVEAQLQAR